MQYEQFPQTRYLGSKRKLLPLLFDVFDSLDFESVLDPFSGTGSVAYLLKSMGKKVLAADCSLFNVVAARALVENDAVRFGDSLGGCLRAASALDMEGGFVETVFHDKFYFRHENRFIDRCLHVIGGMSGYERDLMVFCLGQACLVKRPYNLFHRANLNMRSREVRRSFGNKATWDKSFEDHMKGIAEEVDAAVFQGEKKARAVRSDIFEHTVEGVDLVYLDPPYISANGTSVDYADYYHFLDGLADPNSWQDKILYRYKHRPMRGKGTSPFSNARTISPAFERIIRQFETAQLVVSYRSDGLPSVDEMIGFLKKAGKQVEVFDAGKYTYALSKNRISREVVLVGT